MVLGFFFLDVAKSFRDKYRERGVYAGKELRYLSQKYFEKTGKEINFVGGKQLDSVKEMEKALNLDLGSKQIENRHNEILREQEKERVEKLNQEKQNAQNAVKTAIDAVNEIEKNRRENPWNDTSNALYKFGEARSTILNYANKASPEFKKMFQSLNKNSDKQQIMNAKKELEKILDTELPNSFFGL